METFTGDTNRARFDQRSGLQTARTRPVTNMEENESQPIASDRQKNAVSKKPIVTAKKERTQQMATDPEGEHFQAPHYKSQMESTNKIRQAGETTQDRVWH